MKPIPNRTNATADMEFVKCFTQARFPTFSILPKKTKIATLLKREDVLLNLV